jgi:6-phosphogluconolactonase
MTRLSTLPDPDSAANHAAREIASILREALDQRGVAHLALAGGNTPRRAYELLGGLLDDWSAVELWYGDERCVGPEDPDSNHLLVANSLLAHISGGAPEEHRILGELGPEAAAREYAAELRARVAPAEPTELPAPVAPAEDRGATGLPILDIALLGIGEDGHTASLFPGNPAVEDSSGALCLPVYNAPKPPPERVTLSLSVLRAARHCILLVTGAGKADALAAVLAVSPPASAAGMPAEGQSLPASAAPGTPAAAETRPEGESLPASATPGMPAAAETRAEGESPPASAGPNPRIPASLLVSERLHVVADRAAVPG